MTNSLIPLTELTLSLGLAYVLHSTVLLVGVAVFLRGVRATSHSLRERLWKLAVVVPLLTAPVQVWSGAAPIPQGWQLAVATTELVPLKATAALETLPGTGEARTDAAKTAEITTSTTTVPSPPGGEGARRSGVGAVKTAVGVPTVIPEAPSSGLRPPPLAGAGTERPPVTIVAGPHGNVPASDAGAEVQEAATVSAVEAPAIESLVSPTAALAPTEPPPQPTTGSPRTGLGSWPPTEPPKPRWVESVKSNESGTAVGRTTMVRVDPVAFGLALTVLASILGGLVLLVVQRTRFWLRLRKCNVVLDGLTRRELDAILQRKGISRRVRLLVSEGFAEPVASGVLRWTIIIPHGVEQRLNREQIEGLLAHELAHLVRGDTAWLWVGNIVCSCLWFQPLNFLARRHWQQAAEFLSDDWAVADANVCPISLAQCLTQIAEWRLDRQESGAILAAGGHRSTLSSRIDCLVQDDRPADVWKSRRRKRVVLLGVLAIGGGLVWAVPRAEFVRADAPPKEVTTADSEPTSTTDADPFAIIGEGELTPVDSLGTSDSLENGQITPSRSGQLVAGNPVDTAGQSRDADWLAEWNELQAELKGLNADLIRVAELLEKYPGNSLVREMAEQVRTRAISFEARRNNLDTRLKAEQKQAAKQEDRSPFSINDDMEYVPPGPEFRLQGE